MDTQSKAQAIRKVTQAGRDIIKADVEANHARYRFNQAWKEILSGTDYESYDLPERAIVQYGHHTYEITFDVDEYGPPQFRRIDDCLEVFQL